LAFLTCEKTCILLNDITHFLKNAVFSELTPSLLGSLSTFVDIPTVLQQNYSKSGVKTELILAL
jgi:hypothetical protein